MYVPCRDLRHRMFNINKEGLLEAALSPCQLYRLRRQRDQPRMHLDQKARAAPSVRVARGFPNEATCLEFGDGLGHCGWRSHRRADATVEIIAQAYLCPTKPPEIARQSHCVRLARRAGHSKGSFGHR